MLAPIAKRLEGKVAIITGGASGIGESTARLFVNHGAKVIIADIQDELGHSVCQSIGSDQPITYVHCDVSSEPDVKNAVNTAVSKHGKIDIMFSNAGVIGNELTPNILGEDRDSFKTVFETNVLGGILAAKHAAKAMIPTKKGSILFTSSVASVTAGEASHCYTASKHAVVGLMKNLCVELGKHGIRVNCISPFALVTPMITGAYGMEEREGEEMVCEAANLKEVVLKASDIAEAAVYLGSDESRYVSGLNLIVDGGYTTTNTAIVETMKRRFSSQV